MSKKLGKGEKLDLLVREIGRMNKQLKVLNLKQNEIAENLAKLTRKASPQKPDAPASKAAQKPAGKSVPSKSAKPQNKPQKVRTPASARAASVGAADDATAAPKLAS